MDDFSQSPIWEDLLPLVVDESEIDDGTPGPSMSLWWERKQEERAKGLFFLPAMETECTFKSTETHSVRRAGFTLTHAFYLTATASQGQTIRTGVTIDCARLPAKGETGMSDDNWWLNLYVMYSRATRMEDMLLLRPPPREFLERGPPKVVREQLAAFDKKIQRTKIWAEELAKEFRFNLPSI